VIAELGGLDLLGRTAGARRAAAAHAGPSSLESGGARPSPAGRRPTITAVVPLLLSSLAGPSPAAGPYLVLDRTVPLPGIEGRIDHLQAARTILVCALGNGSLELMDPVSGRLAGHIPDLPEPQGVWDALEAGRIAVACGGDGVVHWFDRRTLAPTGTTALGEDADNVRYDPDARRIWVGFGSGHGSALACLDPSNGSTGYKIPLAGHPEAFQLEEGGTRIFVNVPDARTVQVADRRLRRVIATWPLAEAANFPMALDPARHRVLIATRNPARLIVLGMDSGDRIAAVPCAGDADDVWWDAARNRAYVSGGAGALSVVTLTGARGYRVAAEIPTPAGARTSVFDPVAGQLILAVPHHGTQRAELRCFRTVP